MPSQSRVQNIVLGKILDTYGKQDRGAPPVSMPFVSRPRSAHLAADGTISWKWHSNAVVRWQDITRQEISVAARARRIPARLAERFAALAGKSDEAICDFAGQWGPLRYPTLTVVRNGGTETVREWRRFALLARALLRCAVALSSEAEGRPEDWLSLCEWLEIPPIPAPTAETRPPVTRVSFESLVWAEYREFHRRTARQQNRDASPLGLSVWDYRIAAGLYRLRYSGQPGVLSLRRILYSEEQTAYGLQELLPPVPEAFQTAASCHARFSRSAESRLELRAVLASGLRRPTNVRA
jgi:hypothetical protein